MKYPSLIRFVTFVAIAASASCGDDPGLVAKREKQRAEIARLNGELALINEKIKNMPPNVSEDLNEARELEARQSAEIKQLEGELTTLVERKRALQAEFEAYQAKNKIK